MCKLGSASASARYAHIRPVGGGVAGRIVEHPRSASEIAITGTATPRIITIVVGPPRSPSAIQGSCPTWSVARNGVGALARLLRQPLPLRLRLRRPARDPPAVS